MSKIGAALCPLSFFTVLLDPIWDAISIFSVPTLQFLSNA